MVDQCEDVPERDLLNGSRIQVALRTVARLWGGDKVQHYRWAERGESYCKKLCAAAREVRDWDEAVVKLNRLIHRRDQQVGRRRVRMGVNPIEAADLIDLRAWNYQGPYTKRKDGEEVELALMKLCNTDLRSGFRFDKFGLVVGNDQQ
ncbi:hypothetical protein QBC37DRAFT_300947, partial [Rhypophila decipiens]